VEARAAAWLAPAVATSVSPTPTARRAAAPRRPVPSCCAPSATTASTTARRARRRARRLSRGGGAPSAAIGRRVHGDVRRALHSFYLNYCGGPAPLPINECRYDACTRDADCTGVRRASAPSGTRASASTALAGPTRTAARDPNGRCVLSAVGGSFCQHDAVFCRYSTDPCTSNGDCTGRGAGFGQACLPRPDGQGTMCQDVPPPAP
jgi:hypothetical protein